MSIADKLVYLSGTKDAIKDAIEQKGVTVGEEVTFREYADKIGEISGGGGGGGERYYYKLPQEYSPNTASTSAFATKGTSFKIHKPTTITAISAHIDPHSDGTEKYVLTLARVENPYQSQITKDTTGKIEEILFVSDVIVPPAGLQDTREFTAVLPTPIEVPANTILLVAATEVGRNSGTSALRISLGALSTSNTGLVNLVGELLIGAFQYASLGLSVDQYPDAIGSGIYEASVYGYSDEPSSSLFMPHFGATRVYYSIADTASANTKAAVVIPNFTGLARGVVGSIFAPSGAAVTNTVRYQLARLASYEETSVGVFDLVVGEVLGETESVDFTLLGANRYASIHLEFPSPIPVTAGEPYIIGVTCRLSYGSPATICVDMSLSHTSTLRPLSMGGAATQQSIHRFSTNGLEEDASPTSSASPTLFPLLTIVG